jgi:membrane dipeptidase
VKPYPVVDGHCDTIMTAMGRGLAPGESQGRDMLARNAVGHLDLPRLREGGYACQTMAFFCTDAEVAAGKAAQTTDAMIDKLEAVIAASGGAFVAVLREADIGRAEAAGAVGSLASIEGGECLVGSLEELGRYYRRGVRMIGLTWNRRNELGRGLRGEGSGGLTEFGLAVVREAARLGMVVDGSHLSDEAFDDLAAASERPFVASHSNCRALCSFPRNLDDARIEAIARSGGLVGVTAVPDFVNDGGGAGADLAKLCDHIDHIVSVGGIGCAALGMDFDGYDPALGGPLPDCSRVQDVASELESRGYSVDDVALVMGGNWRRVFGAVIG